ncbi:ABC transporter ATP-binding protein [Acholeplasma sp. OttesenSCG-928-E16]|nr:ABC transporter ATP-binding protein [Acholeplasma sp. OttesenSCG-928-E16]
MIRLEGVSKFYRSENVVSLGMSRVSLSFNLGEFVAITGESGAGKSTLLNVISGLDGYDEGEMYLNDEPTSHYGVSDFEKYRGTFVGFVFQNYNIIDSYTVLQNVMLALEIQNFQKGSKRERAIELIEKVGLKNRMHQKASKLSGGEKQRAVIARALAKDCPIIVADEPTGNLDSESGIKIMELLKEISTDKLVIVVTHNYEEVAPYATRRIKMHDGKVIEDKILKDTFEFNENEQYQEPKNMSFLATAKFALRNILATPKKSIFVTTMFMIIVGLFALSYAGVRSAVDSVPSLVESSVLKALPETRMMAVKRDGTSFSKQDTDYFKSLVGEKNIKPYGEYMANSAIYRDFGSIIAEKTDYAAYLNKNDIDFVEGYSEIDHKKPYDLYLSSDIKLDLGATTYINYGEKSYPGGLASIDYPSELFRVVGKVKGAPPNTAYFTDGFYESNIHDPLETIKGTMRVVIKNVDSEFFIISNVRLSPGLEKDVVLVSYNILNQLAIYFDFDPLAVFDLEGNLPLQMFFSLKSSYSDTKITTKYRLDDTLNYDSVAVNKELYEDTINEHYDNVTTNGVMDYFCLSIHVNNKMQGREVLKKFDNSLYRIYYPANVSDLTGQFSRYILGLLLFSGLFLMLTLLFFILSLVTRNVMASRKKDFAIFRSIGATQQSLSKVVVIEQVIYGLSAAFIVVVVYAILFNTVPVIKSVLSSIKLFDLLFIFLIILIFSVRLGFKFNKKIFLYSVIQTLAGEGAEYL